MARRVRLSPSVLLVLAVSTAAPAAETPDPVALLRGVAAARTGVERGRLMIHYTKEFVRPKPERTEGDLEMLFDGPRYTCRQTELLTFDYKLTDPNRPRERKSQKINSGWDGKWFCDYWKGRPEANIGPIGSPPRWVFDPRIIGLSPAPRMNDTVDGVLRHRGTESRTVGLEPVNGVEPWHVSVNNTDGYQFHFWVDDKSSFRVRRLRIVPKNAAGSQTIDSFYDVDNQSPLPNRTVTTYRKGNETTGVVTMQVTDLQLGGPPDPAVGTLASLEIPPGTTVGDHREGGTRYGYWNGTGVSENSNDAAKVVVARQFDLRANASRSRVWWYGGGTALGVLLLGIAFYVRRRARS